MVTPKRHVYLEPMNITLFGTRVFADIIKLGISRWNHPSFGWILNPKANVLIWEEKRKRYREGDHVKTEAETGGIPQVSEHLEPLEARKGKEGFSFGDFGGIAALPTAWFWVYALQNYERINFCCFKLCYQFVVICYGCPRKLKCIVTYRPNPISYCAVTFFYIHQSCPVFTAGN